MYPEVENGARYVGDQAKRDCRPLETLDYLIERAENHRRELVNFLDRWNGNPQQEMARSAATMPVAIPAGYGAKMCRLTDLQHEIDGLLNNLQDIG